MGNKSTLSNGKITVHAECVSIPKSDDISIGIVALSGTSPANRISQSLARSDWKGSVGTIHKEIRVGAASSAIVFLSFKGEALDMQTVNDPAALLKNPIILAYNHFDQDLCILKDYLLGKGKDQSKDFEIGIGLLFHFCGFNVGPMGE